MAAIRSLSEEHPIMGWLNRVYYEIFAIAPLAQQVLFDKGSAVDLMFAHTGQSAKNYCTNRYEGEQGRFQANYFKTDLRSRGLVDGYGPALKHFPFYEDASRLHDAVSTFMQSFVDSYYSSDDDVMADKELQAWAKEANGDAGVHDFPEEFSSKQTLVDALTHMVHLVSISHHTVNTNELLSVSSTLPFHPSALYQPIPTSKGVKDVAKFLPPFKKVREQLTVGALFARPKFAGSTRTILHMFDDAGLLARMNSQTRSAAATFMDSMRKFSSEVSSRTFDVAGLSQGMPFIWQALDPNVAPYSVTT
ncbi:hypothetical protein LTR15_011898 [Elasticomyces elasticus]|nr:hypothetical protein LTR15_011898 [Elasticomyces elasticus]